MGIAIMPPDINLSDGEFKAKDGKIVYGRQKTGEALQAQHPADPVLGICCDYSQLTHLPEHPLLQGERLLADFPHFFASYSPEASLLHGDLWGGNYAYTRDGEPVIFPDVTLTLARGAQAPQACREARHVPRVAHGHGYPAGRGRRSGGPDGNNIRQMAGLFCCCCNI